MEDKNVQDLNETLDESALDEVSGGGGLNVTKENLVTWTCSRCGTTFTKSAREMEKFKANHWKSH